MNALDLYLNLGGVRVELAWLHLQLLAIDMAIAAVRLATWIYNNQAEAIATATGLTGALLLARKSRWAALGWLAFLASNAAWIYFAWRNDHPGLLLQQLGFTTTSLIGIYVWLIKPHLVWDEWRGDFDNRLTMRIKHLVEWRGRRLDLHQIVGADLPDCFHTHPAPAIRFIVWNGYTEQLEGSACVKAWRPGMVGLVRPELSHRIASVRNGRPSYSLWLRGRKTNEIQLRGPGWANQPTGEKHGM